MSNRVVLLYGIETSPGEFQRRNWNTRLEAMWENQDLPIRATSWQWTGPKYKYAWGVLTWIPWYRNAINRDVIENLRDFASFLIELGETEPFSVIAHSYAGTIVQAALEAGMKFKNIILIATTMDEEFDWAKYDSQFENVLVFWSPKDDVCGQSTYGQQGLVGPKRKHPRVSEQMHPARKHFDWIYPDGLKRDGSWWAQFLLTGRTA